MQMGARAWTPAARPGEAGVHGRPDPVPRDRAVLAAAPAQRPGARHRGGGAGALAGHGVGAGAADRGRRARRRAGADAGGQRGPAAREPAPARRAHRADGAGRPAAPRRAPARRPATATSRTSCAPSTTMLDRLEAERGASTARALAAQEGERQRIARELHDEIGQSLTAVLLALKRACSTARPSRLRDELAHGHGDRPRRASTRCGRSPAGCVPACSTTSAWSARSSALAADFAEASEVPVTWRLDPRLPGSARDAELVVYRIAQEGLTNVARHAGRPRASTCRCGTPTPTVVLLRIDRRRPRARRRRRGRGDPRHARAGAADRRRARRSGRTRRRHRGPAAGAGT